MGRMRNMLIYMVEPSGIEPLTSTLPVLKHLFKARLYSARTVVFSSLRNHSTPSTTPYHPFTVAATLRLIGVRL